MRLEYLLADRAFLRVQLALALAVAGMRAKLAIPPERLATLGAYPALLFHVSLRTALASLTAIDHIAARLGRDRAGTP